MAGILYFLNLGSSKCVESLFSVWSPNLIYHLFRFLFPVRILLMSGRGARDLIIRFIFPVCRVLRGQWNQKTLPLAIHYESWTWPTLLKASIRLSKRHFFKSRGACFASLIVSGRKSPKNLKLLSNLLKQQVIWLTLAFYFANSFEEKPFFVQAVNVRIKNTALKKILEWFCYHIAILL